YYLSVCLNPKMIYFAYYVSAVCFTVCFTICIGSQINITSQNQEIEDLKITIAERDGLISTLMSKVEALEVKTASKKTRGTNASSESQKSIPTDRRQAGNKKKPKKSNRSKQRKFHEDPKKRHPLQMLTCEVPADFNFTKEALYVHIRILWGMIEKQPLPPSPDKSLLKEFKQRFSNNDQIQDAANSNTGATLISEKEVQTLRDARAGRQKIGKHIVNLNEFYFLYIRSLLSKVGIRIWAPDLEEAPHSLYNEACRIIALMTFRQVACSGAYQYMRANLKYLNNINLLNCAYDHFVHYRMTEKFKKENKEAGKNLMDSAKGVTQRRRQRLCRKRYRFAVANNYPNRYLKVLSDVNAHSDDEFIPQYKAYAIKTLSYRSDSANIFFRNLDRKMHESDELAGALPPLRPRCRPRVPINSKFKKTPKRVPVDFYPPKWFNNLDHAQRFSIANTRQVAFIPTNDISMSKHLNPDENLRDKAFNEKFWHVVTEPYDLSHEIVESSEDDDDEDDSERNELSDGDIIDLDSSEEDESDDGNVENTEENQDSQVRWTPDVDEEMVDAFNQPQRNGPEDFFEEGFNPRVWQ
ncbi:hypothetical protein O181_033554, partial [Austropuccinia psidii MF-1]|nr:hypothetical protein [Austropuccinia psidii MF-1]